MTTKADARNLIVAAALTEQKTCAGCGTLLEAYGRPPQENERLYGAEVAERLRSERWSCPSCDLPGATQASVFVAKESS